MGAKPDIRLGFMGAARNVTGSRYLVETSGRKLFVDCGLYQERQFLYRNWQPFAVPPGEIEGVLLTHAHLDHCGLLPRLVNEGFRGPIICTPATADIAGIILLDAAKLQEEDAAYKKKRHLREGRRGPYPEIPLYTVEDAEAVLPLFRPAGYNQPVDLGSGIGATFHDAGHVLGSAMIKLDIGQGEAARSIVFSGDIGRWDRPMLHDPSVFRRTDYIVMESTYGDREHRGAHEIDRDLEEIINAAFAAGGNIIVPAFALQRVQEILYYLNALRLDGRIPELPVYLDSPMAIKIIEVFKRHAELFDRDMREPAAPAPLALRFPRPQDGRDRRGVEVAEQYQRYRHDHRRIRHVHRRPHQAPPGQQHLAAGVHHHVHRLPGGRDARPAYPRWGQKRPHPRPAARGARPHRPGAGLFRPRGP